MNAEWMLAPIFGALAMLIIDAERFFGIRDAILRQIYEEDRFLWNRLGKPTGRLWRPPGEKRNPIGGSDWSLWRRGSEIDQFAPVQAQLAKMRKIGRRILLLDIPVVLVCAVVMAMLGHHHTHA